MSDQHNPVDWFEIPVNDIERAKGFYETVFQVKLALNEMGPSQMAWFPMIPGAPGAAGTLIKGEGYVPSQEGSLVYLKVESIEETLVRVNANGGKELMPKTGIGEHGFIAQFKDCEGNRVALHAMT